MFTTIVPVTNVSEKEGRKGLLCHFYTKCYRQFSLLYPFTIYSFPIFNSLEKKDFINPTFGKAMYNLSRLKVHYLALADSK